MNYLFLYTKHKNIYKYYLYKNTNFKKKFILNIKQNKYKFLKKLVKIYRILGLYPFKNNIINFK
uniref:30S ribosomal protein S18 n=1 Tax=Nephromyces sp. ex Molgula occidentalis TaxID=2544991 RepID=A0A5C1H7E0_9APIC|nr:hypothetical protein [Nephromyces sp. ex Molgula occidentalis]